MSFWAYSSMMFILNSHSHQWDEKCLGLTWGLSTPLVVSWTLIDFDIEKYFNDFDISSVPLYY